MVNDPEKFIYLIPNAIIPYGYELIHILAYPSGLKYRFRFSEKWVSEKIRNDLLSLENRKALIIFRDKKTNCFYPVRHATILKAEKIADVYYIEYRINEIVDYDSRASIRDQQITNFNESFHTFHNSELNDSTPDRDMSPLVFFSNLIPEFNNKHFSSENEVDQDSERFGNVIEAIKSVSFYEGIEFLKIIEIRSMKNAETLKIKEGFVQLDENTTYTLKILQIILKTSPEERLSPNDIILSSEDRYIDIVRGRLRAVGKYDVLTFTFRTRFNSGAENSFLDIVHKPKDEESHFIDPKLHIPVAIKKSNKGIIPRVIIMMVAALFYSFPDILSYIVPPHEELVKDVSMFTFFILFLDLRRMLTGYFKNT